MSALRRLAEIEATRLLAEDALPNPGVGHLDRALDQVVLHDTKAMATALQAVLAALDRDDVEGDEHDDWVWLDDARKRLFDIQAAIEDALDVTR